MSSAKKKFINFLVEQERIEENSKYGQFIIQTNEVQLYLTVLILLKSSFPGKRMENDLERLEFGNLINCFHICAKSSFELSLIVSLKKYKNSRNALAHKMFSHKKLTPKECELSIELGEELLKALKKIIASEIKKHEH